MGVFLGQLPPAEIARLKAELAETLIANFCYPRFLDYRTNSLRMRPVDRSKRQEVWLYLSSVDFTSWNRVDLMAPELQYQIERLFIQFVQRNRSFFGEQGRKRMGDVRMLISSASAGVVEGLRGRVTGQRTTNPAFGSPRPVLSWTAVGVLGKPDPTWEQVATSTMLLQQQLQEVRGEIKSTQTPEQRPAAAASATQTPRRGISGRLGRAGISEPEVVNTSSRVSTGTQRSSQSGGLAAAQTPAAARVGTPNPPESAPWQSASASVSTPTPAPTPTPARRNGREREREKAEAYGLPADQPTAAQPVVARNGSTAWPAEPPTTVQPRGLPLPNTSKALGPTNPRLDVAPAGVNDEDVAIFEQMRQQLIVWLRVEAVRAGLEISNQGPAQLLELLRQDEHLDETRLQVVSTLLDLANQVITNRYASNLDYKQGLMLYLMHTRRSR